MEYLVNEPKRSLKTSSEELIKRKAYYHANREVLREKAKLKYKKALENNPEKVKAASKAYYDKNREIILVKKREYNAKNRDLLREKSRKWREKHNKEYIARRKKEEPLFKFTRQVRNKLWVIFKNRGYAKAKTSLSLIGCSVQELRLHLEKQFQEGMSWETHGKYGWHIDHKIPLASAKSKEELEKLCHYTNLQPLWAHENLSKQDKIYIQ